MSKWPLWAVLTPGEPARLESHVLDALMVDADEDEPSFEVISGSGRYHAIVGADPSDVGAELQIAEDLSLQFDEPVYSINRATDPWLVMSFRNGAGEVEDVAPEALAASLGCPLPESEVRSDLPPQQPLRHVALVEGVRAQEAHRVLEEDAGEPLAPEEYRFEDTPRGLLIASGTGDIGFADVTVSERIPIATAYGVIASPSLDMFVVNILRGGECIGQYAQPPRDSSSLPRVTEIKGERTPERILAALGISATWFRDE
ncbi:MAG TPA: hypothetical protein VFZ09_46855 [Archangium sp.]|uniref:hypothetical protein n=1 Tax=Archangium sp. TaxID=1872627 RepID=UPI002E2FD325|nr:hypothetical protein [Archangium sp.]HEX5753796.1 hypothetical protein [Archangium sp.]